MIKANGYIGAVLGLGLLLTACNNSDGGGADVAEADLVGKWVVNSEHEKGWTKTTPPGGATVTKNIDTTTTYTGAYSLEFKADKTMSVTLGVVVPGTWSVSGNTVTAITNFFGVSDTAKVKVTIDGKVGTFVSEDVGVENDPDEGKIETDITTTIKATKQ
jgi:hypothetical protein